MKFQTAYSKSLNPEIKFPETGRTKQSEKDACDINLIMAKYVKTGHIEHQRNYAPEYDFATSMDFHQALNLVTNANELFEALPAGTRKKFYNDPAQFLDFVQDENNLDEMIEMGLAKHPSPAEPLAPAAPETTKIQPNKETNAPSVPEPPGE